MMEEHKPQTPPSNKWCVVPDGCDPELYATTNKYKGRIIYMSAPDRGLHWLLQEWPNIKVAVPYASLRVFYHMPSGDVDVYERGFQDGHQSVLENGQRLKIYKTRCQENEKFECYTCWLR